MSRPPIALLSVAAVLGLGLAVVQATEPDAAARRQANTTQLPVVGRLAVCPELVRSGSDVVTRLTAGTPSEGRLTVRAATLTPGGGLGSLVLDRGGRVGLLNLRSDNAIAVAVSASGEQAGALEAEQFSRGADGIQRGLANVRCEPTVQDAWFVGGSTTQTADTHLVLVNPYDQPALVNLTLYGRGGEIETPRAKGLVVARRGRVVVKLADLAPEESVLAVRVQTVEGRIAPAMREARAKGDTPLGVDWVPRAGQPAQQLTLPGLPDGIGRRVLYLFAPGEDDAIVRIQTTYADGQFVPDGLEEVRVPGGRVVSVDLTRVVSYVDQRTADRLNKPATLRIDAEGAPVLATAIAENYARFSHIKEIAYVGPVQPLTGPSLVTDNVIAGEVESTVYLTAPDGAARVTATAVPYAGRPASGRSYTFNLKRGQVVPFEIHKRFPDGHAQAVVFTPEEGSSPVFAARYTFEQGQRGPLITVLGLVTQPGSGVPVPEVYADPRTALVDPRPRED
jgi:hypothetical protein